MKKVRILITLDIELLTLLIDARRQDKRPISTRIQDALEDNLARRYGVMPWGVYKQAYKPEHAETLQMLRDKFDK